VRLLACDCRPWLALVEICKDLKPWLYEFIDPEYRGPSCSQPARLKSNLVSERQFNSLGPQPVYLYA
jgi:hypothetical protein